MSVYAGPELTNSGLVLAYDMGNTNKSWKGAPATNLAYYSQTISLWTPQNGGNGSITATDNYAIAPDGTATATRLQFTSLNYCQMFIYIPGLTNATAYTYSVWLKSNTSADQSIFIGDNVTSANILYATITSNWQRLSITQTTSSTVYYSKIGAGSGNYDFLAWGAQLELGTFATPYIPTTTTAASRTTAQAILDPIGKNSITATSLSYASNNTFTFDGNGYLDLGISRPSPVTTPTTYEVWFKNIGSTASGVGLIGSVSSPVSGFAVALLNSGITMLYVGSTFTSNPSFTYDYTVVSHGVFIFDGRSMYVYRNGVFVGSFTSGFNADAKAENIRVGNIRQWNNAIADIYKVNVYSRALSATEVKQNFNALRGRFGI